MLSKIYYHVIVLLVSWIHTIVNENFDLTLCITRLLVGVAVHSHDTQLSSYGAHSLYYATYRG